MQGGYYGTTLTRQLWQLTRYSVDRSEVAGSDLIIWMGDPTFAGLAVHILGSRSGNVYEAGERMCKVHHVDGLCLKNKGDVRVVGRGSPCEVPVGLELKYVHSLVR